MALIVEKVKDGGNGVDAPWVLKVAETYAEQEALRLSLVCQEPDVPRVYNLRGIEEWAADALPLAPTQCLSLLQLAALRWLEREELIFLATDDVAVGTPVWNEEDRAWHVAVLVG